MRIISDFWSLEFDLNSLNKRERFLAKIANSLQRYERRQEFAESTIARILRKLLWALPNVQQSR